jgi:hypothetical protein
MIIQYHSKSWKDKRIDAMNRIIKKKKLSTIFFLEEYDKVCNSTAINKKQYKERE